MNWVQLKWDDFNKFCCANLLHSHTDFQIKMIAQFFSLFFYLLLIFSFEKKSIKWNNTRSEWEWTAAAIKCAFAIVQHSTGISIINPEHTYKQTDRYICGIKNNFLSLLLPTFRLHRAGITLLSICFSVVYCTVWMAISLGSFSLSFFLHHAISSVVLLLRIQNAP